MGNPKKSLESAQQRNADNDAPDRLLSVESVADILGLRPRTMWRMVSASEFPPADFRHGRTVRWRASTVEQWIGQHPNRVANPGSPIRREGGVA